MAAPDEESGKAVPEHAAACPQCGAPLRSDAGAGGIPPGVRGWSWGAFLLNVVWAIGNRTPIGLLMFVPYLWFVMPFVLGFKGREWAWKNCRWESVEQFNRVQREWSRKGVAVVSIVGVIIIFSGMWIPSTHDYLVKAKLSKVLSTLDPIKTGVAEAYCAKGRIPAMHTIVTATNQGQPATPDWRALGFEQLPALPLEVKRLEFSTRESPEIVVEMDKIDKAIDGSTLRARLIETGGKLAWQYEVTSSDSRAQSYFRVWYGAPVHDAPTPASDAPARRAKCP